MSKRLSFRILLVLLLGCMVIVNVAYAAPTNDDFANATTITSVSFTEWVDISEATLEANEPLPSCAGYETNKTIWYSYTPTSNSFLVARNDYYEVFLAAYTGDSLENLNQINCVTYYGNITIEATAGTTYYFQLGNQYEWANYLQFTLLVDPPIDININYYSYQPPSIYTTINFEGYVYDPANIGVESWLWDFGDGTTATSQYVPHQYTEDGEYLVTLTATSYDGRSDTDSSWVLIETHDVALVRFSTPRTALTGQTRQLSVGVSNLSDYTEEVTVRLYKTTVGSYSNEELLGSLTQTVLPGEDGQTTAYNFKYTFTEEDATIGKVTFIVRAEIVNIPDALSGDNELISKPVRIPR